MIGALAKLLLKGGVAEAWARPLAWALLVGALVSIALVAWSGWLSRHDQAVRAIDRATSTIEVLNNTVAADRAAGAAKDGRDADLRNEQSNLQEKADAAADNGASALDAVFSELR